MYSTTQASNLATFVGLVVLILNHYKVGIAKEEIELFLGSALAIGGLLLNWYKRWAQGDLTSLGFRK